MKMRLNLLSRLKICYNPKMNLSEKAIKKDKYGPEYVMEVYDPKIGMNGFLVIDNTVLGPGKGGIRMTPGVTKEEVYRLARTMTWKNALAEFLSAERKRALFGQAKTISLKSNSSRVSPRR